ncbi:MAG: hypothetical protein J6P40_02685 [Oscillospiraceae bacterium]|nr:hypothetical protein [Oscillospiraceae bacterium]
MKLQERLPKGVAVNGKFYRLNLDFRNVLRMMDILRRDDLMPAAREYLALKCLMKRPRNVHAIMGAVRSLLFGQKPSEDQQRVTDFEQDAGLIRAAFRQEYGIDLYRDKLHWIEFSDLLSGLPGGNRYSEVIGIRARPMPKATKWNAEERQWLAKAKSQVALQVSEEERQERYDHDVMNIFAGLMAIAKRGEKPDV